MSCELDDRSNVATLYAKISWRVIPLVVWLLILASLDRLNVGYAKLQMLDDLKFSETVYGFGAGVFFIGYAIFEIPSNIALQRFGARKTLARIAFLWGLASLSTAFVQTPVQFYMVRFLLGMFEAGLMPGVIYYLCRWYPSYRRASIIGLFIAGVPIAAILGGPISGYIMSATHGFAGLANWQWLFLLEGVPSLATGIWFYFYLCEKPDDAPWLSASEKQLVALTLASDLKAAPPVHSGFLESLRSPLIWRLSAINFCSVFGGTALQLWTPTIIREAGIAGSLSIGLIAAGASLVGIVSMILFARHSDRTGERRIHTALSLVIAASGLAAAGFAISSPMLCVVALTVATAAALSVNGVFWAIPASMLSGAAAAGGLALINSLGVPAGFVAQAIIGSIIDRSGSISGGLYAAGAVMLIGALLVVAFIPAKRA